MSRQRITLVTLAVADMARARAFYEGWGWTPHSRPQPGVTFYQMNGAVLALFGRADLAADQGRPDATLGTGAVTLAQNCADDAETDAVFQAAVDAGATVLKRPEKVFWGGYSGYFADPDGHVWEIATNPFWPLSPDGSLTLPPA
ncbi:VOC family protein [Paracoccus angustae]|uniref:VOC family protein n=1 Tax=Paracoccus angustae TaxID=1671480 RepID=A0ABV7U200_9RHOB